VLSRSDRKSVRHNENHNETGEQVKKKCQWKLSERKIIHEKEAEEYNEYRKKETLGGFLLKEKGNGR
jgi:hypothetical protein